jgi:hypothetical protein
MAKLKVSRNRLVVEVCNGDDVIVEDSAHPAPTKIYLGAGAGSCWLTAEEAREVGMELLYRASNNYKPNEDE